ncbi:hypothetical protein ECG_05055 [Echinococcus granulosus]|uniref:Pfam-B_16477 domain containing protein n=1 Tax=Echinococcus granulosus TaxID=6210 RepID=A0A068WVQ6_ECHGR|nr:hypothetical protein ECG_05055 [Echinococcus granulosus]CDS24229.1 Pfam-B_16477 domain containing protein [Echinococcus granulosus]
MGSCHSFLTPFPPNYVSVTFRPTDELWICQGPPHFIHFLRSLMNHIWPHLDHHERHCNAPEKHRTTSDGHPHPPLRNTVFRIPMEPFTLSPIHQSAEMAETAYHFAMMMVAYLYSMEYKMVATGHFVRGTEASTCLFRSQVDNQQTDSLHRLMGDCQTRPPKTSKVLNLRRSRVLEFNPAKRMLVVGLEGWNRLYCMNFTQKLVIRLVEELQKLWPQRITFRRIKDTTTSEMTDKKKGPPVDSEPEKSSSFLVEFEGHPWDSYKEYSDLTPYLILALLKVLDSAGFVFECRANIRGLLDTLFFIKSDASTTARQNTIRVCFSLCHQNTFRVYGGTTAFTTWMTQLLQQLWLSGVASEKQISFVQPDHQQAEVGESAESGDELHFTEVKLNGTPFCIPEWNKDNLLAAQYMIGRLIGVLSLIGWKFTAFLNVYSSPYDKGLLVFERELDTDEEEKLLDLKMIELRGRKDEDSTEDLKSLDLLRPLCFTSYDIDRLCMMGGSRQFLQIFNNHFLRLFDASTPTYNFLTPKRRPKANTEGKSDETVLPSSEISTSDRWIISRAPYRPELLHKVFLSEGHTFLCLLSPFHDHLALTAVAELDPINFMEYVTNYQMWAANSCWPPKMFHKTNARAKRFFHWSQIPLAVLCWVNELINSAASSEPIEVAYQEKPNDQDDIVEVAPSPDPLLQVPHVKQSYRNALITCLDCASTVRNAPPVWIYLIRENKQHLIVENKEVSPTQ